MRHSSSISACVSRRRSFIDERSHDRTPRARIDPRMHMLSYPAFKCLLHLRSPSVRLFNPPTPPFCGEKVTVDEKSHSTSGRSQTVPVNRHICLLRPCLLENYFISYQLLSMRPHSAAVRLVIDFIACLETFVCWNVKRGISHTAAVFPLCYTLFAEEDGQRQSRDVRGHIRKHECRQCIYLQGNLSHTCSGTECGLVECLRKVCKHGYLVSIYECIKTTHTQTFTMREGMSPVARMCARVASLSIFLARTLLLHTICPLTCYIPVACMHVCVRVCVCVCVCVCGGV